MSFIVLTTACKSDDDSNKPEPPRDYTQQYTTEKVQIEEYLKSHYIASVSADYEVSIQPLPADGSKQSIWDQQQYPLQSKQVKSINASNTPEYTVYYITLNPGTGDAPTRYDNILAAYKGTLFNGYQFDYLPFPQTLASLGGTDNSYIEGWQEIIPLFKAGVYVDNNGPDPARYEGYGAGIMFLPSALGYYNTSVVGIPAYSPLVFSFKLYAIQYVDNDGDGILTKDETVPGVLIKDYDTDGDGIPNYLDADDDNDGYTTLQERAIPGTSPVQYYTLGEIPACPGGNGLPRHLDASCH